MPKAVTLPQHFKNHGYHTRSIGKIFHGGGKPSKDPPSWSEAPLYDSVRDPRLRYATEKNLKGKGHKRAASEAAGTGGALMAIELRRDTSWIVDQIALFRELAESYIVS